ncbi:MAG: helix-turn-helix domain-containing protein [Dysgonamonadaceae bacterium]|jgi:hypothetical protein
MANEANELSMAVVPQDWLKNVLSKLDAVESLIKGKQEEELAEQWIESQKARQMLGISQKTWQTYRDNRVIPFSQFGRKIYVKRIDLETFLEDNLIDKK